MKLRLIIFIMLSLWCTSGVLAQNRTVTGQVTDEKLQAVGGATIVESEFEKNATTSDAQGRFTIRLRGKGNRLTISNVGFVSQTVSITNNGEMAVQLATDTKGL